MTSQMQSKVTNMCQISATSSSSAVMRQIQIEKEHFKDITIQLQILVEKMKSLENENRHLQQQIDTMEREKAIRFDKFTQSHETQVTKLRLERDRLLKEIESMQREKNKLENYQQTTARTFTQTIGEKESLEAKLALTMKNLATKEVEIAKLEDQVRDKGKLKDEVGKYRTQNSSLIIQKSELEERIARVNKVVQDYKGEVEQLRTKLAKNAELHVDKLSKQRQEFELQNERTRKEFEEKRTIYRRSTSEQITRDKAQWMKAFKTEFETRIRNLNETNQSAEHTVKVLEDQNYEYKTTLNKLERENETMKKKAAKELTEAREKLTEQYQVMESKYLTELSSIRKSTARQLMLKQELELELAELRKGRKRKFEELEKRNRQYQRDNESMSQLLIQKESRLTMMQKEHVDYFKEINTLQRVLASVEDAPVENDTFLSMERRSKKPRFI